MPQGTQKETTVCARLITANWDQSRSRTITA